MSQEGAQREPEGSPNGAQNEGEIERDLRPLVEVVQRPKRERKGSPEGAKMELKTEMKSKHFWVVFQVNRGGGPEAILGRPKGSFCWQARWFRPVKKGSAGAKRHRKESQREAENEGKSEPEEERKDEW